MKRFLPLLLIFPLFLQGQTSSWQSNPNNERAFVKNEGQYDGRNWQSNNQVKFALSQQDGWFTFFTKKGITHRLERLTRNPNKKKGDHNSPSRIHLSELIDVFFVGANSNVQIVAKDKTNHYYSYAVKNPETKEVENIANVAGYKRIIYKNIYNNIDIEYTLHPDGGIKYNVILHPGADPSQIKMQYKTKHTNIKNEKISLQLNQLGQLEIATSVTKIIEHKPFTYYENSKVEIQSKYKFANNMLTFELENFDNSKKVIIDPWVVTPNFNAGDFTREVETDAAGNVYVIGGEIPMELRKYNSAGVFQWTYVTPWDTNGGDWLGTLATDAAGVSYITQGTDPQIERVSTGGAMVWHNNAPALHEYWTITFNCDNTKLIVAGTDVIPFNYKATIWDIDLNNGNQLASVTVGTQGGFTPIEVRSIAPTQNSKYVYLTHTEVGLMNQNLTACSSAPDFEVDNTHNLGYKCENYLSADQNGGGLKALIANDNYFYTHKGDQILQWDINTGVLLNTVNLPGGSSNNGFGGLVVHCSGLDVDVSGNVYAGSMDRVVKFDANLNVLSSANTTGGFTVYDVSVNSNGEVLAVGALLNNSTSTGRGGRIESLNMTAGAQYSTVCCDPDFCPVGPLCDNGAPVNLSPNTAGGTWSSVPATAGLNTSTGVFDPTVAGPGTYVITYTLACGANTETIIVATCPPMSLCVEANGDITVTGGNGPYSWDAGSMQATCVPGFGNCAGLFTFTDPGPLALAWTFFANGTTVTPPAGVDSIKVTDSFGDTIVVFGLGTLPPCTAACDATITPAGPFCVNDPAVNLTAAQGGGTWGGTGITNTSTGTFDPATAGVGTHNITYVLGCGDNDAITITVNPLPNSGVDGAITMCAIDPATDLFNQLGGTPDLGGTWAPVMTSGTGMFDPSVDAAGTYTYTVTNSCGTSSNDVIVTISANPSPGTNGVVSICSNAISINLFDSLGGTPSTGGTWSPVLTSGTGVFDPAVDGAGTYTYSINDCSGNPQTADVVVTIIAAPNTGVDGAITMCATDTATALFNQLGGTPDLGGTWSPVMTSGTGMFDPSVDAAGTYAYTVTNLCGTSSNDVVVTVNACALPQGGYIVSDSMICEGECVDFTDMSSGATAWSWTFNGGSPSTSTDQNPSNICFSGAGTFTIEQIVSNSSGADTITSTIVVNATPIIDAGNDVTVDLGQSTTLTAIGTNGTYTWAPFTWLTCEVCQSTVSTPDETITYTVTVVDSNGCVATDDITVIVDYDNVVWVPNIFSPNGDGNNDVLYVRGKGVASFQFVVYDRWGEKVFETTDLDTGWDGTFRGKKMNKAVFVYYLKGFFNDGSEFNQKGDVTLIR
jgi:gliding motility-associated-like protein